MGRGEFSCFSYEHPETCEIVAPVYVRVHTALAPSLTMALTLDSSLMSFNFSEAKCRISIMNLVIGVNIKRVKNTTFWGREKWGWPAKVYSLF